MIITKVESSESICLNSNKMEKKNGEIIKPIVIMKAGVFNDYLKTPKALEKSARWWNIPIVIKDATSIQDHPDSVIVTNKTFRVGAVTNAHWDMKGEKIVGDAHIYEDLCPDWLLTAIENGEVKGVSGTYFCDLIDTKGELDGVKYIKEEQNYAPNNIAIVANPACTPDQGCGLSMNSKKDKVCNCADDEELVLNEDGSPKLDDEGNQMKKKKAIKAADKKDSDVVVSQNSQTEANNMAEIEDMKKQLEAMGIQVNSMTAKMTEQAKTIETVNQELITAKAAVAKYELAAKETGFLAQFPESTRELAKTELMPVFMKDPMELVMNHAKRLGELLVPAPVTNGTVSLGAEHVDLPLKDVVENADEVLAALPKTEDALALMRAHRAA